MEARQAIRARVEPRIDDMRGLIVTTRNARSVPAPPQQSPARPVLLVVMTDLDAAELLPAAAARAADANARLLVGMARPQSGFTTDVALAHRMASRDREHCLQLLLAAHGMLENAGVDYELVFTTYQQSSDPAKKKLRISAAMKRLARQRSALTLSVPAAQMGARMSAPVAASVYNRRAHVLAVLTDSAEAVTVARIAGEIARNADLPLALVVPVSGVCGPNDRGETARSSRQTAEDMAAIAGRVQPALQILGVSARVYCAPYRTDGSARQLPLEMAAAIAEVAHLLRAQAVVVSATSPAAPHLGLLAGLHVVPDPLPARVGSHA